MVILTGPYARGGKVGTWISYNLNRSIHSRTEHDDQSDGRAKQTRD
jgi:hypothetical protein